jgi:N-ATPase, AtpR subunit
MLGGVALDAQAMNPPLAVKLAVWSAYGLAAGTAHFALLRWNTALYLSGIRIVRAAAVQLLRVTATGTALAFAAWHGTAALLATAVCVMLARLLVLRLMAPTP